MDSDLLFGKIAVKNNMLTEILVDEGLSYQQSLDGQGIQKTLGSILQDKGYLTSEEVAAILKLQNSYLSRSKDTLYGKIVIKNKLASKEQVLECLEIQKNSSKNDRIGEILVKKKYISFPDHCAVLKAQSRLMPIDTEKSR